MESISEMPFIAGHVALDFVNTAEARGHPDADDALRTEADLRMWGQRYGLITASRRIDERAEAEFKKARHTRELLYTLFSAHRHHRPLPRTALAHLAQLAADAYRSASLETSPDGSLRWRWNRSELATIRHIVVTSAIDLLHARPSPRLKQCPGDHCGWFFLDTTKRGNRRWCSMSECGQEAKNLNRRKTTSPSR